MSRFYEIAVTINNVNPRKVVEVKHAAMSAWEFDDWYFFDVPDKPKKLTSSGQSYLTGGESEEEFAEYLAKNIWEANDGFCEVEIRATYLENLPYETYDFNEDDYKTIMELQND